MAVAETNKIITHGDGQAIAQSIQNLADSINTQDLNVTKGGDQEITGLKSFVNEQGLKTNKVSATDGQDILTYDGTNTSLKGKGTRPLYNDREMALLSDIGGVSATTFWNNFGIRRWEGTKYESADGQFSDELLKYCADYSHAFCGCEILNSWGVDTADIVIPAGTFNSDYCNYAYAFANFVNKGTLTLPSLYSYNSVNMFKGANFTKILIADGAEVLLADEAAEMFRFCPNLVEIGAFDFSKATFKYGSPFQGEMPNLKTIHCKHFKFSFSISFSTAFEEADLVEILNNLDTVSTTQTLTMGSTNLAKLTSDEILIATGKGWALN